MRTLLLWAGVVVAIWAGPQSTVEPVSDIPAISVKDGNSYIVACDPGQKSDAGFDMCLAPRWTCADKTRFLFAAEDGSRHCVRFNFVN